MGGGRRPPIAHAAERWARLVTAILDCPYDPRTLEQWGEVAGVARGTLRAWCRAARLPAKASLDFARLLRAVSHARDSNCNVHDVLDVVDERTLKRLCARGGLNANLGEAHSPATFLERQQLIPEGRALRLVIAHLSHEAPSGGH